MTEPGRLVVIAAPGGSPSARATEVLAGADAVWVEGGPRAAALLDGAGVPVDERRAVEDGAAPDVAASVAAGATVALVTAGTAGASEPVAAVVTAVVVAGLTIEVAPAPVPAVAALVASGLATDHIAVDPPLPPDGAERADRLARVATDRRTTALPVPPARVADDLAAVAAACGPDRPVAVAVEGGAVWRGTAGAATGWTVDAPLDGGAEVVVVVGGAADVDPGEPASDEAVLAALEEARARGLSPGRAAAEVAAATGRTRRQVYALGAGEDPA